MGETREEGVEEEAFAGALFFSDEERPTFAAVSRMSKKNFRRVYRKDNTKNKRFEL